MSLYDGNGNSVTSSRKLINASNRYGRGIPYQPDFAKDFEDLFTPMDWRTTLSASRSITGNNGTIKKAIHQKADGVVGRAWNPEFTGQDVDFGKAATDWLLSWYRTCDIRGNAYHFKKNVKLDSIATDRDGGVLVVLTETEAGYPQVQHIPAHRCGNRHHSKKVEKGAYKGLKIRNGVIENKAGSPVAYLILGDTEAEDRYIAAQDIIDILDPEYHDQGRGIPSTSHGINELRKAAQSKDMELMAQMMLSSYAVVETNELGGIDPDDPSTQIVGDTDAGEGFMVQNHAEGMVKHFKTGSGGKLETVTSNRPSDMWDTFQDRILRETVGGMNWPYELAWKLEGVNGVSIRNIQAQARASVEGRQDVLKVPMQRMVSWAVAKAIKIGQLPPSADWYKWDFTMPPKMSIDPNNDAKSENEQYKIGSKNMTGILQEKGKTHKEHITERLTEIVERKTLTAEFKAKYPDIEIDDRELQMLTPNDQKESTSSTETDEDGNPINNESAKFETLKAKYDTFGVAVRAGAITPSTEDENTFRKEGGFPAMSEAVKGAWAEDEGFRRPITLVSGSSAPPTAPNTNTNEDNDTDK